MRCRFLALLVVALGSAQSPSPEVNLVGSLGGDAEAIRAMIVRRGERVASELGLQWSRPLRVELLRGKEVADLEASFGDHTVGVTLLGQDRIVIRMDRLKARPPDDLESVVHHELVHALLDQLPRAAANKVPRWLHEGYAQSLTGWIFHEGSEAAVAWKAAINDLEPMLHLAGPFGDDPELVRLRYAQSFSFVEYLRRRLGDRELVRVLFRLEHEPDFDHAFAAEVGESLVGFEDGWREHLLRSGFGARFVLEHLFAFMMLIAVIVAALALGKKLRRDIQSRKAMEAAEQVQATPASSGDWVALDQEPMPRWRRARGRRFPGQRQRGDTNWIDEDAEEW